MSSPRFIVTGTDTDIGKTVFAAALTGALDATYWKPVQAGTDDDGTSDSEWVARLSGVRDQQILPEAYRLETACSPHKAARIDGLTIDPDHLHLPHVSGPLVIEGAGGVLVPLTNALLLADVFAQWDAPIILVARTGLGTINHSLLSIEALRTRGLPIHGIAFVGEGNADSERTIAEIGDVRRLGRLAPVPRLDRESLAQAFADGFNTEDFAR